MDNLDELALEDFVTVREEERHVGKIGLLATLFFRDAHLPRVRESALGIVKEYVQLCGERLRWITVPPKYKWARIEGAFVDELQSRVRMMPEESAWQFTFHGGSKSDDATDVFMESLGRASWQDAKGNISYIAAAFPLDFFAGKREGFASVICRWANALKPLHGNGGLGILGAFSNATAHEPIIYSIARHFPGLDVYYPTAIALGCTDGIKGPNWLTVIGDSLSAKIGGATAIEARLGPEFSIHHYDGGVVIQSGQKPQCGDRNRDRWPELYIRLNAVIAPIRAKRTYPFHHDGPHRFDADRSNEWLRRFDR